MDTNLSISKCLDNMNENEKGNLLNLLNFSKEKNL